MKHLLDVNVLLAGVWASHPRHLDAFGWLQGKSIVLCPLTGLGFLRISSNKKAFSTTATFGTCARRGDGLECLA